MTRSAKWGGVGVVDERAGGRAGGGAASPTVGGVNSAPAPASPRCDAYLCFPTPYESRDNGVARPTPRAVSRQDVTTNN